MRPTFLCIDTGEGAMRATACGLVADLIDWIEGRRSDQGRPRCPTAAVVETLRFFLREGVQWRELRATGDRVCGATLRRRLMEWSAAALLRRVHAMLIRMVRSGPQAAAAAWDVVIDSCSVRAKRGGELTGPNPTDRAKRGTKYHVIVASDGIPLAALPSAANVHDTTCTTRCSFPPCCAVPWWSAPRLPGSTPMPPITAPRTAGFARPRASCR